MRPWVRFAQGIGVLPSPGRRARCVHRNRLPYRAKMKTETPKRRNWDETPNARGDTHLGPPSVRGEGIGWVRFARVGARFTFSRQANPVRTPEPPALPGKDENRNAETSKLGRDTERARRHPPGSPLGEGGRDWVGAVRTGRGTLHCLPAGEPGAYTGTACPTGRDRK